MRPIDCNYYSSIQVIVITKNNMYGLVIGLKTKKDKTAWTPNVARIVFYDFPIWNTANDSDDIKFILERFYQSMLRDMNRSLSDRSGHLFKSR